MEKFNSLFTINLPGLKVLCRDLNPFGKLAKLIVSILLILLPFAGTTPINGQTYYSSTDSVTLSTTNTVIDWGRGFRFHPTQDMWVYQIGKRVPANGTYIFTLWDFTNQAKIFEQNSLVNSPGQYVYEPMDSIIKLDSGKQYILEMYGVGSAQYYYGTSSQVGPHLVYYDMRFCGSCNSNTFPTSVLTNYHYGTVDFLYSLSPPCPAVTVPPPSSTSVVQCQAGEVELIASSTDTTYLHYWYDSEFGNNLLHVGDTFTTTFLNKEDTAVFYVNARSPDFLTCPGDRTEVKAIILGNPPAAVLPGALYQGQFNVGGLGNIDFACAGDTLVYEVPAPAGYSNADFGTEWLITNVGIQTSNGTAPSDTSVFLPGASSNAGLLFVPALNEGDSTFILQFTVLDMNNGCDTVIERYVNIAPAAEPEFIAPEVCDGVDMAFTNTTIMQGSGTIDYSWNFGDNTPVVSGIVNPQHLFATSGIYNVTLTAKSNQGCVSSVSLPVMVFDNPEALFIVEGHCSNDSIEFINQSVLHIGPSSYEWHFGINNDTSTDEHPKYFYGSQGAYEVTLVAENNGCTDTSTLIVNIQSAPDVSFSASELCLGSTTEFTNTTAAAPGAMYYEWTIGGNTFTTQHAQYEFLSAGNFTVTLKATHANQCSDINTEVIEIFPLPDASFNHQQTTAGGVDFFANEAGHTSYTWDFGDGNSGNGDIISHQYSADGNYDVILIVASANGCIDTMTQSILVNTIGIEKPSAKVNSLKIFPNPYSEFTNITYELASASKVTLAVFDTKGKLVGLLHEGTQPSGKYTYLFSTASSGFEPGTYIVRLMIDGSEQVQRVIESR